MATIVPRDEMVELLRAEFAALERLCADFDDPIWTCSTCLPGWTVKDVLSHIVGTESMLLGRPAPKVDISHLTHLKNQIAEANEAWVESLRPLPGHEVLDAFREVVAERIEALEAMDQAAFDAPSWTPAGPDETYGRFMRIRHYDCYLHELDISEAAGRADRADPAHVAAALTEPIGALGYIVGRKAGLPAGSSARIRLHGAVEASYLVEVAERARLVESLDGEPTTEIALDAVLFLRLSGGRRSAEPHIGKEVELEGDQAMAEQLATNLAYTI